MSNLTFFSVLKSNIKCVLCKNKKCPVRYYPRREKIYLYYGTRYVERCSEDVKKRMEDILKAKMP